MVTHARLSRLSRTVVGLVAVEGHRPLQPEVGDERLQARPLRPVADDVDPQPRDAGAPPSGRGASSRSMRLWGTRRRDDGHGRVGVAGAGQVGHGRPNRWGPRRSGSGSAAGAAAPAGSTGRPPPRPADRRPGASPCPPGTGPARRPGGGSACRTGPGARGGSPGRRARPSRRTAGRRTGCRSGSRRPRRRRRGCAPSGPRRAGRGRARRPTGRRGSRRSTSAACCPRGRAVNQVTCAPAATHRRAIWCMYCSAPPACGCRTSRQFSTSTRSPASRDSAAGAAAVLADTVGHPRRSCSSAAKLAMPSRDRAEGRPRVVGPRDRDLDDGAAVGLDAPEQFDVEGEPGGAALRERPGRPRARSKNLNPHCVSWTPGTSVWVIRRNTAPPSAAAHRLPAHERRAGGVARGDDRRRAVGEQRHGGGERLDGRGEVGIEEADEPRLAGQQPAADRGALARAARSRSRRPGTRAYGSATDRDHAGRVVRAAVVDDDDPGAPGLLARDTRRSRRPSPATAAPRCRRARRLRDPRPGGAADVGRREGGGTGGRGRG